MQTMVDAGKGDPAMLNLLIRTNPTLYNWPSTLAMKKH